MASVNADSIWLLSALDKLMSAHKADPKTFIALFEKKKLILEMLQTFKIDAKKYKVLVGKTYKEATGDIKKWAEEDLLKLKDAKDDQMINMWFQEMIEATGGPYQIQEKLYQKYTAASKPEEKPAPPKPAQTQPIQIKPKQEQLAPSVVVSGFNADEIVSFKVADSLLESNEEKKDIYEKILERKQKLLDLVKTKTLTAAKYKALLQGFMAKSRNDEMKSDVQFELDGIEDFHDGNVESWFKEILEETTDNLKDQKETLDNLKKGGAVDISKSVKKTQMNSQIANRISLITQTKKKPTATKEVYNLAQMNCFKVFDTQLDNYCDSKEKYKEILEKKMKMLDLQKKGSLTADKYKAMLEKSMKQFSNESIKEEIEFQLSELPDFHNGNLQQWFKEVISNAELFLEDQQETLTKLEKGQKIVKKKDDDDDDDIKLDSDEEIIIDDDEDDGMINKMAPSAPKPKQPIKPQNKPPPSQPKVLIDFKELYSLKALDQFMEQYIKNADIFCLCFQRKEAIFEMMKSGQINPQKYKELQQNAFKTTTNEKLKDIIEMDLMDLTDMNDGNVDEWFKSLIEETGINYEEQSAIYQRYRGGKSQPQQEQKLGPQQVKPQSNSAKIIEKPVINDVICISAVDALFIYAAERKDIVYYKDLCLKREKLIGLITEKRLVSGKYRQINKAAAVKTDNQFLKVTIIEQERKLANDYKGNEKEWFDDLFRKLSQPPPEMILPQNIEMKRINLAPPHTKIDYLIKAMATHQSLLYYYKKNKIPIDDNKYLVDYEKRKRKEVVHSFELIQKDENFDVYNLAAQMFPEINNDVFYGENMVGYKKKAEKYIDLLSREMVAIKDYASKIKKSTNSENIENSKKQVAKCQQNINYLKSWPSGGLVAFPTITEEKVEKYNMDLNKLDKNEVEVCITNIQGLGGELILHVYLVDFNKEKHSSHVKNGNQHIIFRSKVGEKEMIDICKGDKKYLLVRFYKRGFFGGMSVVAEGYIETIFTRSNIVEERVQIGDFVISYVLKVQKPTRPLITEILHIQMTTQPKYKHETFVEQQLSKKYILFSSPSPSQILAV